MTKLFNFPYILSVLLCCFFWVGCATKSAENRIQQKVALEDSVNRRDAQLESAQLIQASPHLTDSQKAKLIALQEKTNSELAKLRTESLKLRAILTRDIASSNYSGIEATMVKRKIKKIETDRIQITFSAIDKAGVILGRSAQITPSF
jgi:hypothetical protein